MTEQKTLARKNALKYVLEMVKCYVDEYVRNMMVQLASTRELGNLVEHCKSNVITKNTSWGEYSYFVDSMLNSKESAINQISTIMQLAGSVYALEAFNMNAEAIRSFVRSNNAFTEVEIDMILAAIDFIKTYKDLICAEGLFESKKSRFVKYYSELDFKVKNNYDSNSMSTYFDLQFAKRAFLKAQCEFEKSESRFIKHFMLTMPRERKYS